MRIKRFSAPASFWLAIRLLIPIAIFLCLGYLVRYGVELYQTYKQTARLGGDVGLRTRAILEAKLQGKNTYQFTSRQIPAPLSAPAISEEALLKD